MSELLNNLAFGFGVALSLQNILLCLVGVLVGTLVGVLPGLGPLATMAMLLPITYVLEPTGALIMLAGIFYGSQYGGSTTAILVNMPGEASSVVTTLDGHAMAKQGRAGVALAVAALGSFVAGCFAAVVIAGFAVPISKFGQMLRPADYFSLMMLGIVCTIVLASGSLLKSLIMVALGLLISMVGADLETGQQRMTLGFLELYEGVDFVIIAMGVFGVAEILKNLEASDGRITKSPIGRLWPTRSELRQSAPAVARGTLLGSILGVLPGGGATLSAFASYTLEKKIARKPERFGNGAIEGVAGPESANNAAAQTSFIPLLTLGLPSTAISALMVGAMTIHGIIPGPDIITKQPDLFWGMIASMWIGNLLLVIINLPLIGLWVSVLRVPYSILFPIIVVLCCIGVYSLGNSAFDVGLMALFTLVGYLLLKFGFEPAPLLLATILGPLIEENLRRALVLSQGDPLVFVERPLSAAFLAIAAVLLALVTLPSLRARRETVFVED